jgi:CcmD family protein
MNYLVAAYIAVWVMLFLYLFSLMTRLKGLEKSIELLSKRLEEKAKGVI